MGALQTHLIEFNRILMSSRIYGLELTDKVMLIHTIFRASIFVVGTYTNSDQNNLMKLKT